MIDFSKNLPSKVTIQYSRKERKKEEKKATEGSKTHKNMIQMKIWICVFPDS